MDGDSVGFFGGQMPPPPPPKRDWGRFLRTLFSVLVLLGAAGIIYYFSNAPESVESRATPEPITESTRPVTHTPTATETTESMFPGIFLTVTNMVEIATIGAEISYNDGIEQTATVIVAGATRTAIALVRDPSLAQRATPAPVQLTMTAIPLLIEGSGIFTSDGCWIASVIGQHDDLTAALEADLNAEGITTLYVSVQQAGVRREDCTIDPSQTFFDIVVDVSRLEEDVTLNTVYDQVAKVLTVLSAYPVSEVYGPLPARLLIDFDGAPLPDVVGRIDTGYENALRAFNDEELRNAALIKALGGFVLYN